MEVKEVSTGPNRLTIVKKYGNSGGGAYFLGFIGALIYYIQTYTTLSTFIINFFKAVFWPAVLVFHLFKYFGL